MYLERAHPAFLTTLVVLVYLRFIWHLATFISSRKVHSTHFFDVYLMTIQVMINMATVYCVKDILEMFINKKITRTTILHHTCVILAYCHVLSVLHGDYNVEGIFKVITKYSVFYPYLNKYDIHFSVSYTMEDSLPSIFRTNCFLLQGSLLTETAILIKPWNCWHSYTKYFVFS